MELEATISSNPLVYSTTIGNIDDVTVSSIIVDNLNTILYGVIALLTLSLCFVGGYLLHYVRRSITITKRLQRTVETMQKETHTDIEAYTMSSQYNSSNSGYGTVYTNTALNQSVANNLQISTTQTVSNPSLRCYMEPTPQSSCASIPQRVYGPPSWYMSPRSSYRDVSQYSLSPRSTMYSVHPQIQYNTSRSRAIHPMHAPQMVQNQMRQSGVYSLGSIRSVFPEISTQEKKDQVGDMKQKYDVDSSVSGAITSPMVLSADQIAYRMHIPNGDMLGKMAQRLKRMDGNKDEDTVFVHDYANDSDDDELSYKL
eukprot:448118_1